MCAAMDRFSTIARSRSWWSRGTACRTLLVPSRDKNEEGTASRTLTTSAARAGNMDLHEQLATGIQGNVVVMGIGNPCRGDDAAGSLVAQKLSVLWPGHPGHDVPGVRVIDA